jgi:hypothetical protein
MRGVHSSKWQQAKEDEIKLKMTNNILGPRINSEGAKTVGCNGSTRQNMTSKGICKDVERDLNQKILREANE